jgi:radical SAM protein with 4Fe4S-binding SPASM domain
MPPLTLQLRQNAKDFLESRHWPDRPQMINFEITAACDARCIHCPRLDMDRPMKIMHIDLFRRMVDQANELGIPDLCPNGYGEICTIPVAILEEYFGYIASKPHPFKLIVNTNGNRMNEERSSLFIRHKVRLINITIDGATAATAEAIRKNLNFDQIEANIKRLLNMRDAAGAKYPKVRVGMVAMPQTLRETKPFFQRWNGVADFVGIGGFSSRLNSVWEAVNQPDPSQTDAASERAHAVTACMLPFRDLNIWADGKVVLCCEDWNEEFVVGDLNTQTIREIWHGPELTEVRRKHRARQGHAVSLCAKCDSWKSPSWGTRLWS